MTTVEPRIHGRVLFRTTRTDNQSKIKQRINLSLNRLNIKLEDSQKFT